MSAKRSVLVFASVYTPGFMAGGPVRSIENLVEHLGDQFHFRIITADRDRSAKHAYDGIQAGVWQRRDRASVLYLRPSQLSLACMTRLLARTPHNLIYLNSFFDPRFATLPLLARRLGFAASPVMLAPRGEFSIAALAIKSVKKQAFMHTAKALRLHHDLMWQASTTAEADDIKRALPRLARDIRIAPDLLAQGSEPSTPWRPRCPGDPLRIAFLSRIAPVKNLHFAIEVLRDVTAPVVFSIHGPCIDASYWRHCQRMIATLPDHIQVRRTGPVPPTKVKTILGQSDLLFLPTLGENFGHVIVEALAASTPALISDRTPWRGLVQAGAGADLPLVDRSGFVAFIQSMAQQTQDQAAQMRRQAIAFMRATLHEDAAIEANQALFRAALSPGKGRPVP